MRQLSFVDHQFELWDLCTRYAPLQGFQDNSSDDLSFVTDESEYLSDASLPQKVSDDNAQENESMNAGNVTLAMIDEFIGPVPRLENGKLSWYMVIILLH